MKKITIVRPKDRIEESVKIVEAYGFEAVVAPMIEIVERNDPEFHVFLNRLMDDAVDYVIFTSVNGVKFSLKKVEDEAGFIERMNRLKIIAIGRPTKLFLEERGMAVDIVPEDFSSSGIVTELSKKEIKGKKIEVLRSSHGSKILIDKLKDLGANVHEVQVYSITMAGDLFRQKKMIESAVKGEVDIFTFTSRMTVLNFLKVADETGLRKEIIDVMNKKVVSAIGSPTKETLEENGIRVDFVPDEFTFEAMIRGIKTIC
ncbi:MAG: uroporphyrinogen-III synthase [Halobacteriota archaeon]|nr:uroporphyrinogen-III synthase [Halobacteriota archaeon]